VILRGLAGLLIGVGYGVLAGLVITFLGRLEPDTPYPGPLIPDANEWRRLVAHILIAVAGVCGVLVGAAAGLTGARKAKAGIVGFGVGLAALSAGGLSAASWREWLTLPIGLSLLGVMVSAATGKMGRPR
jgi:hypothetical protein